MEEILTPQYRIEDFWYAIANGLSCPHAPIYRIETYLAYLCGADVEIPQPIYRIEQYLAYKCGLDVELPAPIYRDEMFLAKWCGMDVEPPTPIYRIETLLSQLSNGELKTVTGNPISISDALAKPAEALTIEILPSQDLHSYANPWPAGGGKQLFNAATFETVTLGTITCTNNGDGSFTLNADEADTADRYFDIFKYQFDENVGGTPLPSAQYRLTGTPSGGSATTYTMYVRPSYSNDTGAGVTFTNSVIGGSILIKAGYRPQNLVFRPMLRLASNGDDTFAPYSNICPITGFTGVNIPRTGKNIFGGSAFKDGIKSAIPSATVGNDESGNYVMYAANKADDTVFFSDFKPNTVYTFILKVTKSNAATSLNITIKYTDGTKTTISRTSTTAYDVETVVFTTASNKSVAYIGGNYQSANVYFYYDYCGIFEGVLTVDDFEPYTGTTYSISWQDEAGTVYGGELDVTTGVLTVTDQILDMASAHWVRDTNRPGVFYCSISGKVAGFSPILACSCYKLNNVHVTTNEDLYISGANSYGSGAFVRDTSKSAMTGTEFKNSLSGQTLVYKLATPITYQLTPTQVDMLLGNNVLWNDVDGDMTLEYLADGPADDVDALQILLNNRYVNNGEADEATDREALDILLGGNTR